MTAFRTVLVGVADLATVRRLWQDTFGFEAVAQPAGQAQMLAQRWGLQADAIVELLMLRTPGAECGQLLFVQFSGNPPSVRERAGPTDLCPKNLDVYVDDLPGRLSELKATGFRFRNDTPSEVTAPNGVRFRELHMYGHDDLNIVLLELIDEPMTFSPKGFAGIGALVTIVRDPIKEVAFHQQHFNLPETARHRLDGPEIERMIGLPPGSTLDITILGGNHHLGQLEIIAYEGAGGEDRYPRTAPPVRGVFGVVFGDDRKAQQLDRSPAGLQCWHA